MPVVANLDNLHNFGVALLASELDDLGPAPVGSEVVSSSDEDVIGDPAWHFAGEHAEVEAHNFGFIEVMILEDILG